MATGWDGRGTPCRNRELVCGAARPSRGTLRASIAALGLAWRSALSEPKTDHSSSSSLSSGVEFVGKLVSAVSIINMLFRATTIPLSHWLGSVLSAYAAVFHPIVDATIGLIPRAFGYELLPAVKDAFVGTQSSAARFIGSSRGPATTTPLGSSSRSAPRWSGRSPSRGASSYSWCSPASSRSMRAARRE